MNDLFKIDDIKSDDPLKSQKEKAIKEVKEWFNTNLNNARPDEDYWVRKGYFVTPIHLTSEDLVFVLEEKKAFINWFLKTFPEFNVAYNSTKRKGGVKKFKFINKKATKKGNEVTYKLIRKWEFEVQPNQLARERDLLFGTNNTAVVTVENWRERIRDATTKEEIEDIASLVKSKWTIDNFVTNCRSLIDIMCQNMQDLKKHVPRDYFFESSLWRLEEKIKYQHPGFWGTKTAKVALFQEAEMKYSYYIVYEALKAELEKVYDEAKERAEAKRFVWDWKNYSLFEPKFHQAPNPVPTPLSPSPNPQPSPSKAPDAPSYSDTNKEEITPLSETESNQKLEELKNQAADLTKKTENSSASKEEKKKKMAEIEEQINNLEENGSGISNQIITELKDQIKDLRSQLEEIKKSLKEILENAKDYTNKLFNWFKNKNVKRLIWQDNGELLIEKNDGKSETLASEKVQQDQILTQFKEYSQQSEQKSLTFSELSQISSVPAPATKEKHWDKYGKYYIGAGITVTLVSAGAAIYHFLIKRKRKIEE